VNDQQRFSIEDRTTSSVVGISWKDFKHEIIDLVEVITHLSIRNRGCRRVKLR